MPNATEGQIRNGSAAARWLLLATILGSGMAFLDGTVVNIALPAIERDLGGGLTGQQWTVNAYVLTLGGLILLGGALGDRLGRKRIFMIGVAWFAVASAICATAPTIQTLAVARAFQGIGAALLIPGSLAIIQASVHPDDRGAMIGTWSGLAGVTTAIGPFVGGYFVEAVSWRLIFLLNLPLAAIVLWVSRRHVPESFEPSAQKRPLDVIGAALSVGGLAGSTFGMVEAGRVGWTAPTSAIPLAVGIAILAAFLAWERGRPSALVPLGMFRSRPFTGANLVTFLVYGALSASLFLIPIRLQGVSGYSPIQAGLALAPLTVLMLLLSSRAGALAQRIGPRIPMTVGPLLCAGGLVALAGVGRPAPYLTALAPGMALFGLGLSLTVAPLTATVLAATESGREGIASAINNAVSRIAGLVAVAIIPAAVAFQGGMWASAGLLVLGGLVAALMIPSRPIT